MLNGNHNTICRFGKSQTDEDNLKAVQGSIAKLYKAALSAGELRRVLSITSGVEAYNLETRLSSLRQQ